MRSLVVASLLGLGCGSGAPPPARPATCDDPAPGQPMTEAMCTCRGGNITLAVGRAVELHCEPGERELGPARIEEHDQAPPIDGERESARRSSRAEIPGGGDGWCCAPR